MPAEVEAIPVVDNGLRQASDSGVRLEDGAGDTAEGEQVRCSETRRAAAEDRRIDMTPVVASVATRRCRARCRNSRGAMAQGSRIAESPFARNPCSSRFA